MKTYPIKEIFYSLQGEGFHTGTPAVFIRFSGCNLACPFCDTDFLNGEQLTIEQIRQRVSMETGEEFPKLVVLTGGEPTLFVDKPLCDWLRKIFPVVAMETNGTRPVPEGVNWVTLSPKSDFLGDAAAPVIGSCDELKILYNGQNDPIAWMQRIKASHYFIQPCDMQDENLNRNIMRSTIELLKSNPSWRLSLQTHKFINIR